MRALLEGRFDDAERLAEQALPMVQRMMGTEYAMRAFWGQVTLVRREQGRLDESWVKGALERTQGIPALRCGLVSIYRELGREAEARCEFERLATHGFTDLPRDVTWLYNLIHLAETCAGLGDARHAAMLYELLLPYGGRNVVVGPGLACYGSASRYLGLLATTTGRWTEAQAHFEAALRFNSRMGARPWVAHTEHDLAEMLLARDAPGDRRQALALLNRALDTGQALEMKRLVERALTLKVDVLGVAADTR
jgi:tetratricopeptide (TPR) repeat protein